MLRQEFGPRDLVCVGLAFHAGRSRESSSYSTARASVEYTYCLSKELRLL